MAGFNLSADRVVRRLYFGLAALTAVWATASLSWPFGWDQGILAWVGDVIHQGGMPYRDAWDIKGPLAYYVYALAQWLFGKNLWGIRLLDLVFLATSAAVLGRVIRGLTDSVIARWACLIFILWYGSGSFWHTAQPDGWASMMILIGMAPFMKASGRLTVKSLVVAGSLVGCAALIKPFFAAFLLIALLGVIIREGIWVRRAATDAVVLVASFALPVTLAAGWFAHRGALDELMEVYLIYPVVAYTDVTLISPASRLRGVLEYVLAGKVVVVLLPVAVLGLLRLWQTARRTALVLLGWTGLGVAIVALQNRFFEYHWTLLLPPLVLLGAVGFHAAFEEWREHLGESPSTRRSPGAALAFLLFLLLLVHVSVRPFYDVASWASFAMGLRTANDYYARFPIAGSDILAADHIRGRTTEKDRVAVWGWNTSVIYLAGRQSASKFGYSMPLLDGEGTALRRRYRREFLADLRMTRPVYIVVAPQAEKILGRNYGLADFPQLESLVVDCYRKEAAFGELTLYRLSGDRVCEGFGQLVGANTPGTLPSGGVAE